MIFRIKRIEECGQKRFHIVNPKTGGGLEATCSMKWDLVSRFDLPTEIKSNREKIIEHMIQHFYIPEEIPADEFTSLYEQVSVAPSQILIIGEFDPSTTPELKKLIEEPLESYARRRIKEFRKFRRDDYC